MILGQISVRGEAAEAALAEGKSITGRMEIVAEATQMRTRVITAPRQLMNKMRTLNTANCDWPPSRRSPGRKTRTITNSFEHVKPNWCVSWFMFSYTLAYKRDLL